VRGPAPPARTPYHTPTTVVEVGAAITPAYGSAWPAIDSGIPVREPAPPARTPYHTPTTLVEGGTAITGGRMRPPMISPF
jgi:hypothetical protein